MDGLGVWGEGGSVVCGGGVAQKSRFLERSGSSTSDRRGPSGIAMNDAEEGPFPRIGQGSLNGEEGATLREVNVHPGPP